MNILSTVISWFKNTFNVNPEEKQSTETYSDYHDVHNISVTATLSERLTTLATVDSTVEVVGDNQRAKYLNNIMSWISNSKLPTIGQICLGTGDCIVKPNTDGTRIGLDIIENEDFYIVDRTGDFLYGVIIRCEKIRKNNEKYERFEYQRLHEVEGMKYVTISQHAFKNGKPCNLGEIVAWREMQENQIVPNVDRLLFGRFKCPKVNRHDINSANGVPITSGADEIIREIKASYRRFNSEFEAMEPMIFADKRVFKAKVVTKDGVKQEVPSLPKGKERVIASTGYSGAIDGTPMIKEWAPNIRDTSLDNGIERNLRMLELFCGLSEGILSKSTLTYTNTDEVRKSTQSTFAFITNFRNVLEQGLNDLMYSIDAILNYNGVVAPGEYTINYDWSDSFVESMTERFNQMLQAQNMDAISKAEFRSWVMNEPLNVAEDNIAKIKSDGIDDIANE
jgi:A118 family predicted phage portal protein